jgi:methylaspartate mutase sigma subunit
VTAQEETKGTVVTGVIGEDVHVVGMRIIEHALAAAGFKVNSLGAQVSREEFIQAALETAADAILVSSFSGHAEILAESFRDMCVEAGLRDVILYIGGYLGVSEEPWEGVEARFKKLGFDRVYPPGTSPNRVVQDLAEDVRARKKAAGR